MGAQFELFCRNCKVQTNCDKSHDTGDFVENYFQYFKGFMKIKEKNEWDFTKYNLSKYDRYHMEWALIFIKEHEGHDIYFGWGITDSYIADECEDYEYIECNLPW